MVVLAPTCDGAPLHVKVVGIIISDRCWKKNYIQLIFITALWIKEDYYRSNRAENLNLCEFLAPTLVVLTIGLGQPMIQRVTLT